MKDIKVTLPDNSVKNISQNFDHTWIVSSDRDLYQLIDDKVSIFNLFSRKEITKQSLRENFDLSPRGIREMLKLNNPVYEVTSAYGHFGRKPTNKGEFTWEKTDKAELFKL